MDGWRSARYGACVEAVQPQRPIVFLVVLAVWAELFVALIAAFAPAQLILPILSIASLAAAAVCTLVAQVAGAERHSSRISAWDIAGGLALVGFVAGMVSDPEHVLQLFGLATTTR
jgi:hypothetical protein